MNRFTLATALLILLGCCLPASGQTAVRFVHTVYNAPPVTVHFDALPFFLKKAPLSASSVRSELPPLTYDIRILDTQSVNPALLHSTGVTLTAGVEQSLVLAGRPGAYQSLFLAWDGAEPATGNIRLRFVHVASSVPQSINVLVGGSLFFPPISATSATGFIEIPLAQAATLTCLLTDGNVEFAGFTAAGTLEAGNAYTIYLLDGPSGVEARVVNETSVDEQAPMTALPRAGEQYILRAVNITSGGQSWNVNGMPTFLSVEGVSASGTDSVVSISAPVVAVRAVGNPSQVLAEHTLGAAAERRRTLAAYGNQADVRVLELPWSGNRAPAGQSLIRMVHTGSGLGALAVELGSEQVAASIEYGTATAFHSVGAQPLTVRVLNAATQALMAEFTFTPSSTAVYTVFLASGGTGVEARLLEETDLLPQTPLPLLNPKEVGVAKMRSVNLLTMDNGIRITMEEGTLADNLAYAHAEALINAFPVGTYMFAAFDADSPDEPLASIGTQIETGGSYLLAFIGTPDDARGVIFTTPKVKAPKDSVLVRFVHAVQGTDELSVLLNDHALPLAAKLRYGDISDYRPVPQGERAYTVYGTSQTYLATLLDEYSGHTLVTVFLVDSDNGITAYILPDEAEEAFRPMATMETTVGVEEQRQPAWTLSGPRPNPVHETTTLQLDIPSPTGVTMELVDATGRVVRRIAPGTLPAGSHTLALDCRNLPSGSYTLVVRSNGLYRTFPLTVVQ